MSKRTECVSLAMLALLAACASASSREGTAPTTPQAAVDELLAADRAFSARAANANIADVLGAMFAADVMMPTPDRRFAKGRDEAVAVLRTSPDNAGGRLEWTPIRGGISADGLHGFTFGYMTLRRADGSSVPMKYLSYWVKGDDGWRVVAYKRARRPAGDVSLAMMPPAIPDRLVAPITDTATIARHRESLAVRERAFSNVAQTIGLGAAFEMNGSADAINLGGPTDTAFVVGAAAIGRAVSRDSGASGSPVKWAPDERVIVASSGDLGVTLGWIRLNEAPPPGQPDAFPFFTVWRRPRLDGPWRYIAE